MSSALGVSPELLRRIRSSTAPEMDPEVVETILRGYFSGKRDSIRTYRLVDATVEGRNGSFNAMAVDVSRSGVLLRIMDPCFASEDEIYHLMPYTARVWYHFEGGLTVHFAKDSVVADADVVRVTGYCGRGSSLILIGCRFRERLTHRQCGLLGIEHAEDRPPGG